MLLPAPMVLLMEQVSQVFIFGGDQLGQGLSIDYRHYEYLRKPSILWQYSPIQTVTEPLVPHTVGPTVTSSGSVMLAWISCVKWQESFTFLWRRSKALNISCWTSFTHQHWVELLCQLTMSPSSHLEQFGIHQPQYSYPMYQLRDLSFFSCTPSHPQFSCSLGSNGTVQTTPPLLHLIQ